MLKIQVRRYLYHPMSEMLSEYLHRSWVEQVGQHLVSHTAATKHRACFCPPRMLRSGRVKCRLHDRSGHHQGTKSGPRLPMPCCLHPCAPR